MSVVQKAAVWTVHVLNLPKEIEREKNLLQQEDQFETDV
jgi:hypothetical protein